MPRPAPPLRLAALVSLLAAPAVAPAQAWRTAADEPLLVRATALRQARDTTLALAGWRARARGIVRFASIIGHGTPPDERVIKADELVVEVYGEAPNRSKQAIVAWRDTSFLPTRIVYHRDHLGIVASDFGARIRLGDGDEVRDVPHPLSLGGLAHYEVAPRDTITITQPDGTLRVAAFDVRPRNPAAPGTVGTLYLDLARAALVRFRFTFTAASYRDRTVADITVVLENALLDGATWLPWRQAIAIRRETPWLDLPLATMLRADWEIGDYALGVTHPPGRFLGPSVDGLRRPGGGDAFEGVLAERLDALPATATEREAVRRLARERLEAGRLDGLPRIRLAAEGVSGVLRATRVQGVTLGAATRVGVAGWQLRLGAAVGTADRRATAALAAMRPAWGGEVGVRLRRAVVDLDGTPPVSGVLNSLRTVVDGADLGDWTLVHEAVVVAGGAGRALEVGWTEGRSVAARFRGLDGTRGENPALGGGAGGIVRLALSERVPANPGWRFTAEWGGLGTEPWTRIAAMAAGEVAGVTWRVAGGLGSAALPGWRSFAAGGRGTLPGIPYRAIGGRRLVTGELALLRPVALPTPPVPFARQVPLPSRIGPFLAAGVAGGGLPGVPWDATGRVELVAGIRAELWGPLLRLDAGVALRTGAVGVTLDVHPDWWPIL